MELFFTNNKFLIAGTPFVGVPFFVDSSYTLLDEINEFFTTNLILDTTSPQTWKSYGYWIQDFLKWTIANHIDWKLITKQEVMAYRNWSLEDCKLKPPTVNGRISVIKRFYKYASERKLVKKNPITSRDSNLFISNDSDFLSHTQNLPFKRNDLAVREYVELPKYFSDDELRQIAAVAHPLRLLLMIRIMLESGLRRNEVASLPSNLVLKAIQLAQKLGPGSLVPIILPAEICKGFKSRQVHLCYSTIMQLMHYRNTVRPRDLKKFKAKNKKDPDKFWLTQLGTEYQPVTLSNEIRELGNKIAIEANPHKFRHTFATNFYAITRDIRLLQKILGHSNIQSTLIYEHSAAEDRFGVLAEYHRHIDKLITEKS